MLMARIGSSNCRYQPSNEAYFQRYRESTIGYHQTFESPYGQKKLIYADWAASGRLYGPIESKIANELGPFVANTHTESNLTGTLMTQAYEEAKQIIKNHVHANEHDIILFAGSGMTGAVNKLQRLLGLKIHENLKPLYPIAEKERPVIFVTHMEHHSNHISWAETIGDVVCLPPGPGGMVDPTHLERLLLQFRHRPIKIGAFTACSNVTGFEVPIYQLARKMHEHGGVCFVDFSASAPYTEINMHRTDPLEKLDGIVFSPHKFLGGPGTSGVLIMDSRLCLNCAPDQPGGGTVSWTNPWGGYEYKDNTEAREDGGTPAFLQAVRTALCIRLKEQMGYNRMLERKKEVTSLLLKSLNTIPGLHILGGSSQERMGIVSFVVGHIHYNLIVKLLNDRFGIQVRGGCSCAGPYGHYLLGIDQQTSKQMTDLIHAGDLSRKPGWVRLSLHPMMTNQEVSYIASSLRAIVENITTWQKDYIYQPDTNEWRSMNEHHKIDISKWFNFSD
ncbi:aminotransferase class V-fold PLP-dependent enzyme [Paenibacillus sp. PvR133]|jgi:selenocysteine lyase/cysteine desulfurase|uniref:aminotransferase class V-fold PLP-dependent enzyme n=1 Tax=Paenibacillus sp. PvR133 TaxID=2806598 RepID=UPI001AE8662C|nr:aminotransferase class V-fold PLP-dependent enzyme [Paenibacillus sp. PvR133]